MAKSNNKEKLTYKQMLGYMDFLNSKLNEGYKDLDSKIMGVAACMRSFTIFLEKEKEFTEFLKKKEREASRAVEENLGSDAQNKTIKMENS